MEIDEVVILGCFVIGVKFVGFGFWGFLFLLWYNGSVMLMSGVGSLCVFVDLVFIFMVLFFLVCGLELGLEMFIVLYFGFFCVFL